MNMLEGFTKRLTQGLAFIAGASLLLMMLQTVGDVLMARFFNKPIEGNMEIISVYHMILIVFLPLALVELRHEHISADLFVRMMPAPLKRALYVLGCLVSIAFIGMLCYQTWIDAVEALKINEVVMGSIYIPVWPAKFALPVGFAAILLVLLLHVVKMITEPSFVPAPASPELDEENLPAI